MDNFNELVRCLRDCCGTDNQVECDCEHCLFRDKIIDAGDWCDYTGCVNAMGLAAADAIEYLMRKLASRELALTSVVGCLGNSTIATADVLDTTEDLIT